MIILYLAVDHLLLLLASHHEHLGAPHHPDGWGGVHKTKPYTLRPATLFYKKKFTTVLLMTFVTY